MILMKRKLFAGILLFIGLSAAVPGRIGQAEAAGYTGTIGVETSFSYRLKIEAPVVNVYSESNIFSGETAKVYGSQVYDVRSYDDGWAEIASDSAEGFVRLSDGAVLIEVTRETVNPEAVLREKVVSYALQFVGGRYVWGGTDPHTGADCSGFTAYVMRHAAGVSLSHSSRAQAGEGRKVKTPKPGDLIFYSNDGEINHVAIYIGNGQIVHASSEKTGIKVSPWNKRTPVKIVDVLS